MGPNEQNQHLVELRQKVCLYIHALVLLRCLPSLDVKNKPFVTKKRKDGQSSLGQTDYSYPNKDTSQRPSGEVGNNKQK